MYVDSRFCRDQIRRLSGHPRFPQDPVAITELIAALQRIARSENHAKRTVDALLESRCEQSPTAADITQVAWNLLSDDEKNIGARCPTCNGTGYVIRRRGEYEGAERCSNAIHQPAVATDGKERASGR